MKILIPDTYDFSKGVKVDQDSVNQWIKDAVIFLLKNPNENHYSASTGNTKIIAVRGAHAIHVSEFKNYKEHTFFLHEEREG